MVFTREHLCRPCGCFGLCSAQTQRGGEFYRESASCAATPPRCTGLSSGRPGKEFLGPGREDFAPGSHLLCPPSDAGMLCAAFLVSEFPARQRPLRLQGAEKPSKKEKKKFISRKETQTQQPSSYRIWAARNEAPEGKKKYESQAKSSLLPASPTSAPGCCCWGPGEAPKNTWRSLVPLPHPFLTQIELTKEISTPPILWVSVSREVSQRLQVFTAPVPATHGTAPCAPDPALGVQGPLLASCRSAGLSEP